MDSAEELDNLANIDVSNDAIKTVVELEPVNG